MANVDYADRTLAYTVTLTLANTEYSQLLPDYVKAIEFKARDGELRYAFETGKVAGSTEPYSTLEAGAVYSKDHLYLNKTTLYLASSNAGMKVEIRVWL